jgi:hypothetical protein
MSIVLPPQKTLAEMALEAGQKRYVSLETASKITGYTAEYLKRLCDLYRLEYRLRPDGDYAVEVEALLRETQTILISYEGIPFLETEILLDPHPKVEVPVPDIVTSAGETNMPPEEEAGASGMGNGVAEGMTMRPTEESRAGVLSFIGRSVVSDPDHPLKEVEEVPSHSAPVHVPIVDVSEHGVTVPPRSAPPVLTEVKVPEVVQVVEEKIGELTVVQPSFYRPLSTAVDATLHHDASPLFPTIPEKKPEVMVNEVPLPESPPAIAETPTPAPSVPMQPSQPSRQMTQILRSVPELTGVLEHREISPPAAHLLEKKITSARQVRHENAVGVFHGLSAMSLSPKASLPLLTERRPPLLSGRVVSMLAVLLLGLTLSAFLGLSARRTSSVSYDGGSIDENVAAVGAVPSEKQTTTALPVYPPSSISDAFSDEVLITSGENGKVEVSPILRDRVGNPVTSE